MRRNWLGLIPVAAASTLTIVGIVLNLRDDSGANPGGPLLGLGAIIAVATLGVTLLVTAVRGKADGRNSR